MPYFSFSLHEMHKECGKIELCERILAYMELSNLLIDFYLVTMKMVIFLLI